MIRICDGCGIENPAEKTACGFCGGKSLSPAPDKTEKLYVDLNKQPFAALARSFKDLSPVFMLFLPVFLLILFGKKILNSPFTTPALTSRTPRMRPTRLEDAKGSLHKSVSTTLAWFAEKGFETCHDATCVHLPHPHLSRLLVNRDRTRYAAVTVNAATRRLQQISLYVLTAQKKFLMVVNRDVLPIETPDSLVLCSLPGARPDDLTDAMADRLHQLGEPPRPLSLPQFLRVYYKVDVFSISQAVRQGVLVPETDLNKRMPRADSTISMCINHPLNAAVRLCTDCRAPLCEACYSRHDGNPYCDPCLGRRKGQVSPPPLPAPGAAPALPASGGIPADYALAGLGVRLCAKLLDVILLTGAVGGIACLVYALVGFVFKPYAAPLALISFQTMLLLGTVLYFILLFSRLGGTPGQRVLGIRVIDSLGRPPGKIAAAVRFGYHILSALFVFPALGYGIIPFRKSRQGLHDRLADTRVITRHPGPKALFSWVLLGMAGAGAAYGLNDILGTMFSLPTAEIRMDKIWETKRENSFRTGTGRLTQDTYISLMNGHLTAVGLNDGQPRWSLPIDADETAYLLNPMPEKEGTPLVVSDGRMEGPAFYGVAMRDGSLLWRIDSRMGHARASLHPTGLLLWNARGMACYDLNGRLIWKQSLSIPDESRVLINSDIFIIPYGDDEQETGISAPAIEVKCISTADGRLRWTEEIVSQILGGIPLGGGYQLIESRDTPLQLVYLPNRRQVWTASGKTHPFVAHKADTRSTDAGLPLLYTTNEMLRGTDGSFGFSYPKNTTFLGVTEDWLILKTGTTSPKERIPVKQLLILDRFSGRRVKQLTCKPYDNVVYLKEDQNYIYCMGYEYEKKGMGMNISASLLLVEKSQLTLQEIKLGNNVAAWAASVKVLPGTGTLFLSASGTMGCYRLPARNQ